MDLGNVTAEKFHVDRECTATEDEIRALAEDIRDNKLQHRIIVSAINGRLIDGLKRFKAYEMLGWSVVPAIITDDPVRVADAMQEARQGQVVTPARALQIKIDFDPLLTKRRSTNQSMTKRGNKKARGLKNLPPNEHGRDLVSRATGLSANAVSRLAFIANAAHNGDPVAIRVHDGLMQAPAGSLILGFDAVQKRVGHKNRPKLPIVERRAIVSNVLSSVLTSLDQIVRVGGSTGIDSDHLELYLKNLDQIQKVVVNIKRDVRRGLQENEQLG